MSDKIDKAAEALEYEFCDETEEIFTDLKIPYHHKLKQTLAVKSNILINGFIPPNAQRFSVDLCSYDKFRNKKTKEIIFHFNPRFGQNCIVRNTYINGEWGQEEVHAPKKNPFRRGSIFIMEIYVMKLEYLVSVNGVHFCSFAHRIHPSNVEMIDINGDIQLLKVELSKREMYPSTERTIFLAEEPHNKMNLPFVYEFKYPLMEMWDLTILGTVLDSAERFTLDFCCDCDKCTLQHKNIVFHFNPRVAQNYVARNSKIHEEWGIEESHALQKNPFKRGQAFILEMFVTKEKFMVSVNGKHFCSFQHRLPFSLADSLEVHGDIDLKKMEICMKSSYPSQKESLYPELHEPVEDLSQPIFYNLSEPLTVGTIIEIKGRILLLPYEFFVNLQKDKNTIPHPIIPYHISMRWRTDTVDSTVLNSWIDGAWQEEIVLCPLLRPNSNFTITIYVQKDGYSTVVKAPVKPYSTVLPLFTHKMTPEIVNTIYIQGDIHIYSIQLRKAQ